jgi:hypothetical protein
MLFKKELLISFDAYIFFFPDGDDSLSNEAELNSVELYFYFICVDENYAWAMKEIKQGFPFKPLLLSLRL